jgi:hypothetical protein
LIWLIVVGVIVAIVYWISSPSRRSGHYNPQTRDAHLRELERKRIEAEISYRQADQQRHYRGWRRR